MKHFLITKINTHTRTLWYEREYKQLLYRRFDEKYLRHRLGLFDKYVVPSVESQTCGDFTWLVCIHPDTDGAIKKEFASRVDNLIEVSEDEEIANFIEGCGDVITTNLDSDDLISMDYIENVQRAYDLVVLREVTLPVVLSFPDGFMLDEKQELVTPTSHTNNPFVSLVERVSRPGVVRTISSYNHGTISDSFRVITFCDSWLWATVIHENNIANRLRLTNESGLFSVSDLDNDDISEKSRPYYDALRRFKLGVPIVERESFDAISCRNSSDRWPQGYSILYDELFAHLRYSPVRILEIGFRRGRGARSLAEYFLRGVVHSIDYHKYNEEAFYDNLPAALKHRLFLHNVDQSSEQELLAFLSDVNKPSRKGKDPKKFNIVIDDGSHKPEDQILSFEILWDALADGGYYIIEDLHPYYEEARHPTVDYFINRQNNINLGGCVGVVGAKPEVRQREVGWTMFPFMSIVVKKPVP